LRHPLGYVASDIYSRYKRQLGFNVLHPMGFDAFGLPAENYAIQTGRHPAITTSENIKRYKQQLEKIGLSYDWSREVQTCASDYYRWTQWIFTKLYESYYDNLLNKAGSIEDLISVFEQNGTAGIDVAQSEELNFTSGEWNGYSNKEQQEVLSNYRLAYKKVGFVNWCEALGTVLANDQVKDGLSDRGGHPVVQKAMSQWYLRITAYSDRLLEGLDKIDWSDALKTVQRNWIGRSEGASIHFQIENLDQKIEVFTTRADTIFGATFMVLAPLHDLVKQVTSLDQQEEVDAYVKYVSSKSEIERMAEKKVTGVFTGSYALHPFTQKKMPIYLSEYVLKDYGTGAIMAVPSDDDRDQLFAEKFGIDIVQVVDKSDYPNAGLQDKVGTMINSDFLNGLSVVEAIPKACSTIEEQGLGKIRVNYKMRDSNFSRQRYWGEPFPVKYDKEGIVHIDNELPVVLPETEEFMPSADGKSPLQRLHHWVNEEDGFTRETDVMPAVAGSSWYFLRYMDPQNPTEFVSKKKVDYWQDVDLYIGGTEHAVAHLMYARFWHKFLFDLDLLPTDEPFKRLVNQGMIQGRSLFLDIENRSLHVPISFASESDRLSRSQFEKLQKEDNRFDDVSSDQLTWESDSSGQYIQLRPEVEKMSKSKYNVVNPDEIIDQHGADVFRMFEMFLGPIEQHKPWDTKGIEGVSKFMRRFFNLFYSNDEFSISDDKAKDAELKILHTAIKKVRTDIERLSFNTCISAMMVATNEFTSSQCNKREILQSFVVLIAPFAPHTAEYLWHQLGNRSSVVDAPYPNFDEGLLVENDYTYPISINGKVRTKLPLALSLSTEEVRELVLSDSVVQKWIEEKEIRKFIHVQGRIVNIVI